jgi:hypothetical protein
MGVYDFFKHVKKSTVRWLLKMCLKMLGSRLLNKNTFLRIYVELYKRRDVFSGLYAFFL